MPARSSYSSGVSVAHHQAFAERDAARVAELRSLGKRARDSRFRAEVDAGLLACRLYYCHEGGLGVDELAAAAGLTRDEAFAAIDGYRAEGA